MSTIKVVRRKNKQKNDGTAPLAIRISKDYKTHYNFLGQYVLEKDWDPVLGQVRRSYPNYKRLNNFLLEKLTEANNIVFDSNNKITSKETKNKIKGKNLQSSFFKFAAERVLSKFRAGTYSVANAELSIMYNILEFYNLKSSSEIEKTISEIKNRRKERISRGRMSKHKFTDSIQFFTRMDTLYFEDINISFIKRYKNFCKVYLNQKTRTITNQLIFIRTVFNSAIKERLVEEKYYPFAGDNEKIRIGNGLKIGLTEHEVERIENLRLTESTSIWHARNVWLIAFYFAGIRITDVVRLKWSDFKDGRLLYVMNKNEKPLSLKIPEKAKKILIEYKNEAALNRDYVFPFFRNVDLGSSHDIFVKSRNASSLCNKYLKRIADICGIEKNITNHIARHSFGNIAGDKIHPLMLQKLYRHSDLKTTLNYQANFIHKEADDALESVLDFSK